MKEEIKIDTIKGLDRDERKQIRKKWGGVLAKRCQICDGPIKDGRCVSCGMLYKKDGKIYYLNVSRTTNHHHADKNKQAGQSLTELLKQELRQRKKKRLEAEQKKRLEEKKNKKSKTPVDSLIAENKTFAEEFAKLIEEKEKKEPQKQTFLDRMRKRKVEITLSAVFVIVIILALNSYSGTGFYSASSNSDLNREEAQISAESEWYDDSEYKTLEEALSETEEGYFLNSFYMYPEDGVDLIGKSLRCTVFHPEESMSNWEPGYYMAVMKESSGILRISSVYRVCEEYVSRENNYLVFELENGENVEFQNAGDKYAEVYIYAIDREDAVY